MVVEELLEVVNHEGIVIKILPRSEIHGNPSLLHKVVHLIVVNKTGQVLLQKRSYKKDVAPEKWDTSVGGHVNPSESLEKAIERETLEELGFLCVNPRFLYSYIHSNSYESELVYTYLYQYEGPFDFNKEEIDEIRFWNLDEIEAVLEKNILSDNFKSEFNRYIEHTQKNT
ncbi:MAG TPA: NUDIX domain-containing protein [Nitrospirae bacterium]|nr:NUDIX domain-containing protein [Nitrospirota bacterium]